MHPEMQVLAFIVILCGGTLATKLDPQPCCYNEGNVLSPNGLCADNTHVAINCTKYLLQSTDNSYKVLPTGELELDGIKTSLVPQEDYCISHLTEENAKDLIEVALICFSVSNETEFPMFLLKGTLFLISVAFILATLYVYYLIPDLRETLDKVTCYAIGCLAIFMFVLSLIQIQVLRNEFCVVSGYFVFFFSLAYFAWLNVVMANIWKISVLHTWRISERHWYLLNHLYAWGVPTVLLAFLAAAHHIEGGLEPNIGQSSCWFHEPHEQLVMFYLPVSCMLGINVIFTVWSAYGIHRQGQDISPDRKRILWYKCKLYLKLFLLGGCTWITEVLSFLYGDNNDQAWYWLLMDIINGLHGVLIFFVLIIWRHRIRRELAGHRICCYRAPDRWAQLKDNEQAPLAEEGQMFNEGVRVENGIKL